MNEYRIDFLWDNEATVWVATSDDVPGLVLEHGSFDALIERVKIAIPELLELNGGYSQSISLSYFAQRNDKVGYGG